MASTPKDPFAKPVLIAGLVLLAAAVFVLVSNLFSTIQRNSTVGADDSSMVETAAQENLTPIGTVVAVDKSVAPKARSGEEVYNAVCTACHASGVLEAPKLEKAAWTDRIAKGLDGLMNSAINGINQMPARGGDPSITDEELQSAIIYMTGQAGFDLAPAEGGAAQTAAAPETTEQTAAEPVAPAPEKAPAEPAAPVAEKAPAEPAAPVAEQAPAQPEAAQAAAPAAQSSIDGQKVYQSICFSCHDSGIANSPKPGDKAAWEPRIATGIEALYGSVLNGKGAMPAKGGNPALSDDEIRAAVDWMVSQSQ
ncbi:MAG: c-type cytochrome [Thiolinea sp.]